MPSCCAIFCEILIAILIPPLGVCLKHGCCSVEVCICLLLTILGYVPGIIYALYAIVFVDRQQYFEESRQPLYATYYRYAKEDKVVAARWEFTCRNGRSNGKTRFRFKHQLPFRCVSIAIDLSFRFY